MINAKQELLYFLKMKSIPNVKCARIKMYVDEDLCEPPYREYILKINYSFDDMEEFLKSINFEYNNGYGGQELFGYIWFVDGTWAERYEYGGAENWVYKSCPVIPEECLEGEL